MTKSNWAIPSSFFACLVAWVCLGIAAACSSDDQAVAGGRVEHPGKPVLDAAPTPLKAPPPPPSVAPVEPSAVVTSAPSAARPLSASDEFEERTGIKFSSLEKSIMDDCPARVWSKNVSKRQCTKDSECGDGFCDRGRCAALWTCIRSTDYARRCEREDHCSEHPCTDGRCRSCTSDAECVKLWRDKGAKCQIDTEVAGARVCTGTVPSIMSRAVGTSDAGP